MPNSPNKESFKNRNNINTLEQSKRIIKYILMGFIVLVAVRYIPNQPIETKEISNPSYEGKILMYPKQFLDNYFDSPPPVEPTRPQAEEDDLPF